MKETLRFNDLTNAVGDVCARCTVHGSHSENCLHQIEINGCFICKSFKILKHVMAFSKTGDFFNIMKRAQKKNKY